MKSIQNVLAAVVLALWMLVSLSLATAFYMWIGVKAGPGALGEMERALGGITLFVHPGFCLRILWAQVLFCFPVLLAMAVPAAWWLRRWYRT
ncbi:MAG TPA: hypothetical protein P5567_09535 [Kiritimatiellia bacterium]|nr:hypothetical protein [Kiritimatiellia bacterium]HRZ12682.1 hypothetical protein [Kiritimatiellia bacterium]HSA19550.1 hypothetical protein [Kiritimatiellia bacterium]